MSPFFFFFFFEKVGDDVILVQCPFKGVLHPNWNWACFVYNFKFIKCSLESNMIILKQIIWETLTSVGPVVDQTCKILFWSITQEPLGLLKLCSHFEFFPTICSGCLHFFPKCFLIILRLRWCTKHAQFNLVWDAVYISFKWRKVENITYFALFEKSPASHLEIWSYWCWISLRTRMIPGPGAHFHPTFWKSNSVLSLHLLVTICFNERNWFLQNGCYKNHLLLECILWLRPWIHHFWLVLNVCSCFSSTYK